ncbi:Thioesterase/thiol ester dehydrase-isomerase [Leucogyrophana mollusca]|uniref:Thioesterase/thiol ester dehydrase-isomerase n=1 Tax=Leucogyrophana mollusca TaxID=85980 RepID=A0ACB8B9N7_9AGAM|nr:Thioesterase/thiol ester dehydrase-isomerase [Leucogyrophana mollusca]
MSAFLLRRALSQGSRSNLLAKGFSTVPPTAPRSRRYLATFSLAASVAVSAYTFGALFPHPYLTFISPRPAPGPPDPGSPASIAYTDSLERELQSLPLLVAHRTQPDANEWYEARPYKKIPEERRVNSLTAGALKGPGKLALPPLVRCRDDESESLIVVHVGRGLCGHDGIVHGGMLATILDESLARVAINNLPDKIGVTANLSINYRAPTFADQFIVIRVFLTEKRGRKSMVAGRVEDLKGNVLVEATATFVQPRYSQFLSNSMVKQAMGEPEPKGSSPVLLAEGMPPPAAKS